MGGIDAREYRFTIPVLPPSVNSLHQIIYAQRKVVLKPEILRWRSDIALFIPRITLEPESFLRVDLKFFYPHYYKNGKLKIFDTHNLVKVLLDVLAWKANFNDCRVKEGSWSSVDSAKEQVEVVLRELSATNASQPATSSS